MSGNWESHTRAAEYFLLKKMAIEEARKHAAEACTLAPHQSEACTVLHGRSEHAAGNWQAAAIALRKVAAQHDTRVARLLADAEARIVIDRELCVE